MMRGGFSGASSAKPRDVVIIHETMAIAVLTLGGIRRPPAGCFRIERGNVEPHSADTSRSFPCYRANAIGKSGTVAGLIITGLWLPPVNAFTRSLT
jgi:hypothetical protein